jgi:hypothetical protein
MKLLHIAFIIICLPIASLAQIQTHQHSRVIQFPDVPGYLTLSTDLHQHTVFSDGYVWPNIRVLEAAADSLDVISMTDHIEYLPHKEEIPPVNFNRSHELASQYALPYDLVVIQGAEITRGYPPGHTNALFIQDANLLNVPDSVDAFKEAKRQGAFLFWNHPDWFRDSDDAVATLHDLHRDFIKNDMLHGIEVVNDLTYSEEALQIALDQNLTIMGTSDIHGLVDWQYHVHEGGHRPVTLVFATERTTESIKEALFDRRTVVYFNDMLIGREQHVKPLLNACIALSSNGYIGTSTVLGVTLSNNSNALLILANQSEYNFRRDGDVIILPPGGEKKLEVKVLANLDEIKLDFQVMNAITAPGTHPEISIGVKAN